MIAKQLLDQAIDAMTELHRSATSDLDEETAVVPAAEFRKFVDAHARLLYERNHMEYPGPSIFHIDPSLAKDLRLVLSWEAHRMGAVSAAVLKGVADKLEAGGL